MNIPFISLTAREIISQARSEINEGEMNYLNLSRNIEEYHVVPNQFYKHRASGFNNKSRSKQENFWRHPTIWKSNSAWTVSPIKTLAMSFSPSFLPFTPISANPPSTNTWVKRQRSEYTSRTINYPFVGLHVSSNRDSGQLILLVVYWLHSHKTIRVMNSMVYWIDFIILSQISIKNWSWVNRRRILPVMMISTWLRLSFKNTYHIFHSSLSWLRFRILLDPKQSQKRSPS